MLAAAAALPAAVTIRSDFEGGSIGRVRQLAPRHFRCGVKGEVDQDKRNRQASWYYFRLEGGAGAETTIDLTDLPGEYNYKFGALPITGATRPFISYDRKTWTVLPESAVEWDAGEPRLRMRFTPARSPVWVAHVPPYTTEDLNRLLADKKGNPNLTVAEAGKSAAGRALWLLTVTNPARPASGKKVLWLMARQHAWESGTSWVVDGAVRFLLQEDARAARLRDAFIFKIFPMADPDGVVRGGVRFNVNGYDVNRNWDIADPKLMPEIAALRKTVLGWVDGGGRIDLFLSLHNTSSDYLKGPLTAAGPRYRETIARFAALLARDTIFEGKAPRDWAPGKVERGRMDVCQGLFHDRGIRTLLMEQNVRANAKLGGPAGVEDYKRFGAQLVPALAAAVEGRDD